jgi:hypothetical protein
MLFWLCGATTHRVVAPVIVASATDTPQPVVLLNKSRCCRPLSVDNWPIPAWQHYCSKCHMLVKMQQLECTVHALMACHIHTCVSSILCTVPMAQSSELRQCIYQHCNRLVAGGSGSIVHAEGSQAAAKKRHIRMCNLFI